MRYSLVTCYAVLWLLMLVPGSWGQVNRLPFFTNHFFDTYLLISEDTPVGSSVTQLLARDMDNDPLVFGVSGEEASRFFAVEPDTGVVWLRQPLDRETKSEFTVEFSVSDHQGVITRKVNIQVGDVNDNAPTFHNQPYSVRIPENTPVGTPIFIVNATDPDLGAGGSVLYSFQPPSPFFAIDSARGIVTVIQELDYEVTQAYQLTVNATGTTVRVITAVDQDKGRPRGIGYTIVSDEMDRVHILAIGSSAALVMEMPPLGHVNPISFFMCTYAPSRL